VLACVFVTSVMSLSNVKTNLTVDSFLTFARRLEKNSIHCIPKKKKKIKHKFAVW